MDTSNGIQKRDSSIGPKRIVFFHPDLGLGGAERLVIDAAVGLQNLGHKVTVFTSHCDRSHCFEEVKDGTLDVRVRGNNLFPVTFFKRFHILLATLRQLHLLATISLLSNELKSVRPDFFFIDQLSACVPLLRWLWPVKQRILFYCHFPDQLLAQRNDGGLTGSVKGAYRWPFDWFEGWSMSGSDRIVVNSFFTRSVVNGLFDGLGDLGVVYPCVNTEEGDDDQDNVPMWGGMKVILSINRFERKKDVGLAIRAFHGLKPNERKGCRLVVAGGYDQRVPENVQYHQELVALAESLGLSNATTKTMPTALAVPSTIEVLFLLSIPGPFKSTLLRNAKLLVYTPANEHFGIVPVEAMYQGVPVLAANTGGPLETVVEGKTGWLRDVGKVEQWSDVMRKVIRDLSLSEIKELGRNGTERVRHQFSRTTMAERLEMEFEEMADSPRRPFLEWQDITLAIGVCGVFVAALLAVILKPRLRPNID